MKQCTLNIQNIKLEVFYEEEDTSITIVDVRYKSENITSIIDLVSYFWKKHFGDKNWGQDVFYSELENLIRENNERH